MDNSSSKMTIREICKSTVVTASVAEVWHAWTTIEGTATFFAPRGHIRLEKGGPYELYFDLDAPAGQQGSEGCTVLEFASEMFLSFTWNFPPSLPSIRGEHTTVGVGLQPLQGGSTRVVITHTGWQAGDDWTAGFEYFNRAWALVLARLKHRFAVAPLDWNNPYTPDDL
jgi:uncharacterized protein YndB with AHSA1/START domain